MYQTPTVQRPSVNADANFMSAKFLRNKGHVNSAVFFGGPGAVNRVMRTWNINLVVIHSVSFKTTFGRKTQITSLHFTFNGNLQVTRESS